MPALRIFEAEAPSRDEAMPFDRLPIPARKDPRLSAGAVILLAAIVPKGGRWPDWVELTDDELQHETGQSRSAVQRHFKQLEEAGWIMRVRRRGRRKIHLLFNLAGIKHAPEVGHACTASETRAPQLRYIHGPETGRQDLREEEPKILKGSTPATRPQEGASPSSSQTQSKTPEADPMRVDNLTAADVAGWRSIQEDPRNPFAKVAARVLARYEAQYPGMKAEEGETPGPAPCEEPPGQASRERADMADSVHPHSNPDRRSGQDKRGGTEHNRYYRSLGRRPLRVKRTGTRMPVR
jgi:hypothetical protein